ncbi:MAG: hypothetical protein QW775_05115 [Ignisphaera sp.]|uniref:Uncharacterized protein n=1 Tax=Ignisphaera aggregans TaxID=334771 RepID=A0A7C4JJ41_9CREN
MSMNLTSKIFLALKAISLAIAFSSFRCSDDVFANLVISRAKGKEMKGKGSVSHWTTLIHRFLFFEFTRALDKLAIMSMSLTLTCLEYLLSPLSITVTASIKALSLSLTSTPIDLSWLYTSIAVEVLPTKTFLILDLTASICIAVDMW